MASIERAAAAGLAHPLRPLRDVRAQDELTFHTLGGPVARVTDLLTERLGNWQQTYRSRPSVLSG